ncbi:hypothetical protein PC9H_002035 [Pleurotus ostreatus]|uniref:Uncharacterized protein n=1 Tax=Pleurotus ostreatus TaxID=5322 RepID=A0A8H6ZPL2_PLEOS|nr:uncharacterized protein PC9H_002035 [Pleurotus ostreatus]KAF7419445.1 hypothetical protein PC9H_002035 [Pleurotus ostreatus]
MIILMVSGVSTDAVTPTPPKPGSQASPCSRLQQTKADAALEGGNAGSPMSGLPTPPPTPPEPVPAHFISGLDKILSSKERCAAENIIESTRPYAAVSFEVFKKTLGVITDRIRYRTPTTPKTPSATLLTSSLFFKDLE